MNAEELRPIRLEIALSLVDSTHPDALKVLAGITEADPVIAKILREYGVVI
jgi:hypothetical protein